MLPIVNWSLEARLAATLEVAERCVVDDLDRRALHLALTFDVERGVVGGVGRVVRLHDALRLGRRERRRRLSTSSPNPNCRDANRCQGEGGADGDEGASETHAGIVWDG